MNELPVLRIELDGIKQRIAHTFADHNDCLNKQIEKTINETLTEEWVQYEINIAVKNCIRKSIENVSDNWRLQEVITNAIAESIEQVALRNQHKPQDAE